MLEWSQQLSSNNEDEQDHDVGIFYPLFGTAADLAGLYFMNQFHSALFSNCPNCCPKCVRVCVCAFYVALCYVNPPLRRSLAEPWAKISFAFSRNILHVLSHRFGKFHTRVYSPHFYPLGQLPFLLFLPPKCNLFPSQLIAFHTVNLPHI